MDLGALSQNNTPSHTRSTYLFMHHTRKLCSMPCTRMELENLRSQESWVRPGLPAPSLIRVKPRSAAQATP